MATAKKAPAKKAAAPAVGFAQFTQSIDG